MTSEPRDIGSVPDTDWWWLARRSFGIPDIVSDSTARDAIVGLLASGLTTEAGRPVAEQILDAALKLGKDGELEYCFLGERLRDHTMKFGPNRDPAERILVEAACGATEDPSLHAAAELLLIELTAFVRNHPFEDVGHPWGVK
jgi:hypothetical protein